MRSRSIPALLVLAAACGAPAGPYDLVVRNGRVIDPATKTDQVRDVAVAGGRIAAIGQGLAAKDTIDATGLVVSPGFIDLHSHSVPEDGPRWQVRDGVTTALELEEGGYPVAEWLGALEGKSLINFGVSAGHIPARIAVIGGATSVAQERAIREKGGDAAPPAWSHQPATPEQLARILTTIEAGLDAGGLGIGFELNEQPGTTRDEVLAIFDLAKRKGVPVYAHLRTMGVDRIAGSLDGAQEVLADVAATGASAHFVHLGSSALTFAKPIVGMIEGARKQGLDVTGEVYPYTAASTYIQGGLFDGDWQSRLGISFGDVEWPPTGERMTAVTFPKYFKEGGAVIIHFMKDADVDFLVGHPGVIIASDAMPLPGGRGHPRGVGTFARVLGRYVREKKALDLMTAIEKMTLLPAERVRGAAPSMANKGRIAVGADADLTVFDPATVLDRATFAEPAQASAGIPYVVVNGTVVVRRGEIVPGVAPGRAIKRGAPAR